MSKNDEATKVKQKIDGFLTKYAEKQIFGYTPEKDTTVRKVGDKWIDEDGKEWVQCEGYKARVDSNENLMETQRCIKCGNIAISRADKKMMIYHRMCLNCVTEMETQLRIEGKWEEYEKTKVKENIRSFIKDTEQQVDEYIKNLSNSINFVNVANEELASVDYEKWENNKDDIEELKSAALLTLKMMHEDFEKSFGEKVHKEQLET